MPLRIAASGMKHYHVHGTLKLALADPRVEVVAVAEGHEPFRSESEAALGIDIRYDSHTQLLESEDFDVLIVCEEFANRGPTAIDALRAGKHVFADKPLCTREPELREIASLSREKGLEVGVDFSLRSMWGPMGAALREGAIGEIVACRMAGPHGLNYGVRPMWYFEGDLHGGILNDLFGHGVDYVRWVCDREITQVLSATRSCVGLPQHPGFETAGTAHYQLEGPTTLYGYVDYLVPKGHGGPWTAVFTGTEGDAWFDDRGGMRVRRSGEGERSFEADPSDRRWRHPFLDFAAHLLDGDELLRSTEDGFRTSMATLVAQRAAVTGETNVPVPATTQESPQ